MWRSVTVLLLGVLCLGQSLALSSSTTTSIAPTKSSSKIPARSSATPSPTLLPPGVNSYTYIIPDATNDTLPCLRMVVDVALNFTYTNSSNNTKSVWIRFQNTTVNDSVHTVNSSTHCSGIVNNPSANLTLKYISKELVEPFFVTFSFVGDRTSGNQHWSFHNLSVGFEYQSKLFPDNQDNILEGEKTLYTNKSLFDDTNKRIEFTRPYICLSNQTIDGFTVLGHNTTVGVWVRQLEVQAFTFLDGSNGTFSGGNGIHGTHFVLEAPRVCLLDNNHSGNEVVPIAVGAALAVLVIIVLIAYLVGRVRNKKKSSYEALK